MFSSHLTFAHSLWREQLHPGSSAIDATCGNGYDSLFLLQCGLSHLYCLDIQREALEMTKGRLAEFKNFSLHRVCHSTFPMVEKPVDLIVYNLGYLPGGDKGLTTRTETTLLSIESGLKLLTKRGLISVMVYPGHREGKREEESLLSLSGKNFQVHYQRFHERFLDFATIDLASGPYHRDLVVAACRRPGKAVVSRDRGEPVGGEGCVAARRRGAGDDVACLVADVDEDIAETNHVGFDGRVGPQRSGDRILQRGIDKYQGKDQRSCNFHDRIPSEAAPVSASSHPRSR